MAGGFAGIASMFGSISGGLSKFASQFSAIGDGAKKMWADLKAWVNDKFIQPTKDALDSIGDWWEGFKTTVGEAWDSIMLYVGEKLALIWDMLPTIPELFSLDWWAGLFTSIGTTIGEWAIGIWDMIPSLPEELTKSHWEGVFGDIWDMLPDIPPIFDISWWIGLFASIGTTVGGWATSLWDMLPDMPDFFSLDFWTGLVADIGGAFGNIGTFMLDGLKGGVNILIGLINDLLASISFSKTLTNPITGTEYTFGMDLSDWNIPTLAKGGIVNSPTLAMIGEDGPEAVVPLSQRNNPGGIGTGGGTYNITVNAGGITDRTDKRALAREIGNMIQQELSRNMGGSTMRGR